MSAPVLTVEQIELWFADGGKDWLASDARHLADSHETLRAERDAALSHIDVLEARVAVLAAECRAWRAHNAYTVGFDRDGYSMARAVELAADRKVARAATDAAHALDGGEDQVSGAEVHRPSEKDRQAKTIAFQLEAEFGAMYGNHSFHSGVLKRLLEALAVERAEGHRAGMERAAEIADDNARPLRAALGDKDNPLDDMLPALHAVRGAADTSEYLAAAIWAAAGEGDPK